MKNFSKSLFCILLCILVCSTLFLAGCIFDNEAINGNVRQSYIIKLETIELISSSDGADTLRGNADELMSIALSSDFKNSKEINIGGDYKNIGLGNMKILEGETRKIDFEMLTTCEKASIDGSLQYTLTLTIAIEENDQIAKLFPNSQTYRGKISFTGELNYEEEKFTIDCSVGVGRIKVKGSINKN